MNIFGIYRTKVNFLFIFIFFSLSKKTEGKQTGSNELFSLSCLVISAWLSAVIGYNIGYTICTWKMVYNVIEMKK